MSGLLLGLTLLAAWTATAVAVALVLGAMVARRNRQRPRPAPRKDRHLASGSPESGGRVRPHWG